MDTVIKAIGDLWPLALVLTIAFLGFLFRNPLAILLKEFTEIRYKKGQTELSLQRGKESESKPEMHQEQKAISEPPVGELYAGGTYVHDKRDYHVVKPYLP